MKSRARGKTLPERRRTRVGKPEGQMRQALRQAWSVACVLGHSYVGTEHILIGIALCPQCPACRELRWQGLTAQELTGQLLLLLLHAAVPMGIVAIQGDYGTAIIFASATVFMLFAAGLSVWYILAGCAILPFAVWFIWNHVFGEIHRGRIMVLIHPGTDPLGLEYQQDLGLRAIRAGGLLGQGLKAESYVSVPEMHNDFIFSFIAQAFGFVGAAAVILLLAVICLRLFSDSRRAKDTMGKTICMGVFAVMFTHCLLNIGMVLKVMPVIGVPLPFFSAGGTAMVSMYLCIGLAVSAYTHNVRKYRVFYDAEPEQ